MVDIRIDHEVGVYTEHYSRILKWYNLAFKDKHPSKEDEKTFHLFNVVYDDLVRANLEEQQDERD